MIVEHQSSLNRNMALRMLLYITRIYEKMITLSRVKRHSAFLCTVLAAILPLSAETRIVETAGSGILIESTPARAKVFIDGIERGFTPLSLDGVIPGVHTFRAEKDRYNEWTAQVTVSAQGRLEIFIDLRPAAGTISVNITEEGGGFSGGARIFLDGAESEGREVDALPGWRTVKVSAFGRQDAQKSIFVAPKEKNERIVLDFDLKRAAFELGSARISRSAMNPAGGGAQGMLAVDFTVSAPGTGRFTVLDENDDVVFSAQLGEFERAEQRYIWDGRDKNGNIPKDGVYRIRIEAEGAGGAEGAALTSVPLAVRIDSSLDEGPLSLASGLAGLFLVPVSDPGTSGTFQVEAGMVFGKPPGEGRGFDTIPFSAGVSLSPAGGWQLAAALNIRPGRDGAVPAAAVSVKREFRKPAGVLPGVSALIAYGWVKDGFISAFGIKSGLQLNAPFSWRFGRRFSLHAAPALLWTGGDGFPQETAPRVALLGGMSCRFPLVSAGLSAQTVITPAAGLEEFCRATLSGEFRFTPPRSNLSIGLLAGGFFNGDDGGGYGGLSVCGLF